MAGDDLYARINRLKPLDLREDVLEALRQLGGEAQRADIIQAALDVGGWTEEEPRVRSRIRGAARTWHLATQADYVITTLANRGEVEPTGGGRWRLAAEPSAAREAVRFGAPYRRVTRSGDAPERFAELSVDLAELDRRTARHMDLQDDLASALEGLGIAYRSPAGGEPQYDIAFEAGQLVTVVEIKTLGDAHHAQQFRLGLGQVIEYRELMAAVLGEPVAGALLLERVESEHWPGTARSAGVAIIDGAQVEAGVHALIEDRVS